MPNYRWIRAVLAPFRGGRGKNRTFNKRIKSPLLCQLSYTPGYSVFRVLQRRGRALEVSRTPNPRLRRPMLYPVELRAHGKIGANDAQASSACQGFWGAGGGESGGTFTLGTFADGFTALGRGT